MSNATVYVANQKFMIEVEGKLIRGDKGLLLLLDIEEDVSEDDWEQLFIRFTLTELT